VEALKEKFSRIPPERRSAVIWLIVTVFWFLCPIDDAVEAFLGPFALSDEVMLSIITFLKFKKSQEIALRSQQAKEIVNDKVVKKVSEKNETAGKVVGDAVNQKIDGVTNEALQGKFNMRSFK
jgi:hypothetical protein